MKKGSMLVETLVVILITPLLMVFLARLFHTLLTETPRLWKDVQQNTTMLNMFSQMQRDIDKAKDFPLTQGEFVSSNKLLLIEQADALIGYELDGEHVVRKVLRGTQMNDSNPRKWLLPDAKIEWKVHRENDKGYVVEIRNRIEYQKGKRTENKMANSHLFFAGAF